MGRENQMRISEISVKGLFGIFDHVIPTNMDDRITIIHGPNGFGKTAILRLIDGLFNSRYRELRTIPFKEFGVRLDNGKTLRVRKVPADVALFPLFAKSGLDPRTATGNAAEITLTYGSGREDAVEFVIQRVGKDGEFISPTSTFEDLVPGLHRLSPGSWRLAATNEILRSEDVLDRFGDDLSVRQSGIIAEPNWIRAIKNDIRVQFIQTQRLLNLSSRAHPYDQAAASKVSAWVSGDSISSAAVVNQCSADLAKAIQSKVGEYAAFSQSLDRTFPARLLRELPAKHLTVEFLSTQLSELENKRNRLAAAGLLGREPGTDFTLAPGVEECTKEVLSVYVRDVQEKLSIFDEIAAKIDLFKGIINNRFKYKEMDISRDEGIRFTTYNGDPLPPTALSSGEQHELVLLYEFLFKTGHNSLILMDEPEISRHVAWQEQFLQDLQQITNLASFDVLIATHSPQIINDRWDLTVELKGPDLSNGRRRRDDLELTAAPALQGTVKD
jgi:predicted ATP-binding protein involved in virulence